MNVIIDPHHVALFEITMLILNNAFIVSSFSVAMSPSYAQRSIVLREQRNVMKYPKINIELSERLRRLGYLVIAIQQP